VTDCHQSAPSVFLKYAIAIDGFRSTSLDQLLARRSSVGDSARRYREFVDEGRCRSPGDTSLMVVVMHI
jgi:hypothetical protein